MDCPESHNGQIFCPKTNSLLCKDCEKSHPCRRMHKNCKDYAKNTLNDLKKLKGLIPSVEIEEELVRLTKKLEDLESFKEEEKDFLADLPGLINSSIEAIKGFREEKYELAKEKVYQVIQNYKSVNGDYEELEEDLEKLRKNIEDKMSEEPSDLINACKECNIEELKQRIEKSGKSARIEEPSLNPIYKRNQQCIIGKFKEIFGLIEVVMYGLPLEDSIRLYYPNNPEKSEKAKLVDPETGEGIKFPYGFAFCQVGRVFYWTGGTQENLLTTSSKAYLYSYDSGSTTVLNSLNNPRKNHTMVHVPNCKAVVVIGGYNEKQGYMDSIEMYEYDSINLQWKTLQITLNKPRDCATACVVNEDIYVIGGKGKTVLKIERISLKDSKVEELAVFPYTMCAAIHTPEEEKVIIFGGKEENKKESDQAWTLNVKTKEVEKLDKKMLRPDIFPYGIIVWKDKETVKVIGNVLHVFKLETNEWETGKLY